MRSVLFRSARRLIALTAVLYVLPAVPQVKGSAPPEFIQWLPVTDAERSLKTPVVEKDAGAEILLWRVHVSDDFTGSDLQRVFYHYVRLKIFDEKGKEKAATIDLDYREPGGILNVAGRTIKPDGSILELDRKSVYKRDLVRAGGRKQKVVSFAMPGVEPGAIVEYRWTQTENDNRFRYLKLHFQREFPVQKVTYFVKPLPREIVTEDQLFLMPLNSKPTPIQQSSDGYSFTMLDNVPASHDEPYAPSQANTEPWALLYYRKASIRDGDKFWSDEGRNLYKDFKDLLKVNDDMKRLDFVEAASAAKTDDEKIAMLLAGLHKNVRNLFDSGVTTAERQKFIEKLPRGRSRNAGEIWKSGMAMSNEMNVTFAALASMAGLEARAALVADRQEVGFNPKAMPDRFFLSDEAVAVKRGNEWRLLDASSQDLQPGMLTWEHEGVAALLSDPKTPTFVVSPMSTPESSTEKRVAHLKLSADGTLEGDIDETTSGHRAEEARVLARARSAQKEESLHDRLVRMFPEAEVTDLRIENYDNAAMPITIHYHLKAPLYAGSTGKRLLFQPIPFQRGISSIFSESDRKLPIEFPYAWKEIDEIHIQLPEGYTLDNAESPGSLTFGEPGGYVLTMAVTRDSRPELITKREFTFGSGGHLLFPIQSYPSLKKVFDEVHLRDSHTLSLIQKTAAQKAGN